MQLDSLQTGGRAAAVCLLVLAALGGCIGSRTAHELGDGSPAGGQTATSEEQTVQAPAETDSALAESRDTQAEVIVSDHRGDDQTSAPALNPFDNFHTVAKGRAYRSAQLTAEKLRGVIATHGIKTVVNLRGPNSGKDWYDAEKAACEAAGVRMVDVPLSAGSLPSKEHVLALYDLFQDASAEPLLLHCRGGADRSGMISAMWRMEVLGDDREAALRELSWVYGHFAARYPDMTAFIRMFEPSREWIEREYNPAGGGEMTDE